MFTQEYSCVMAACVLPFVSIFFVRLLF
uniref:Uncharacterized protein n=1 Tax=Arundo donax TaxID=35708 RepID=A0A0A9B4H8_ARUDO